MANIKVGYGQVEPNHLSAQRNGRIYAQAEAESGITVLENGSFVKFNPADGLVYMDGTGLGDWELVYNEVKLYDPTHSTKDFAQKATDGDIVPRRFGMSVGDIFTTNNIDITLGSTEGFGVDVTAGILTCTGLAWADEEYAVVKETTMPDGSVAVKVRKVQ